MIYDLTIYYLQFVIRLLFLISTLIFLKTTLILGLHNQRNLRFDDLQFTMSHILQPRI